jgi:DNA-binding response OmpR family regulator
MAYTILIVDDDGATRDGLAALLRGAGYNTLCASTVEAAFAALAAGQPDLLISDVRLEGENGLQLLAAPKRIPAIVITGFADPGLEMEARDLGGDYFLKPLAPSVLLARIAYRLSAVTDPSMSE